MVGRILLLGVNKLVCSFTYTPCACAQRVSDQVGERRAIFIYAFLSIGCVFILDWSSILAHKSPLQVGDRRLACALACWWSTRCCRNRHAFWADVPDCDESFTKGPSILAPVGKHRMDCGVRASGFGIPTFPHRCVCVEVRNQGHAAAVCSSYLLFVLTIADDIHRVVAMMSVMVGVWVFVPSTPRRLE